MVFYIIIPVHNESAHLKRCLQSFVNQSIKPDRLIIVNDSSTDNSQKIIDEFSEEYSWIENIYFNSKKAHSPGSKVINAFYEGFNHLDNDFDFIGKFDADIILPPHYFEKTLQLFASDNRIGIAGGNLYIKNNIEWEYENISKKTKVRGPIKLYRKECFKDIGGLKKSIGWDTVDVLLAHFYGWKVKTDTSLHVKHLKPTGKAYGKKSKLKQGEAFYKMRYGFWLSFIAASKLAFQKKSFSFLADCLTGYFKAKNQGLEYIVSEEEGKFIRALRWRDIKKKLSY